MSLNISQTFAYLGRLAGLLNESDEYHGETLVSLADAVASEWDGLEELIGRLYPTLDAAVQSGRGWAAYAKGLAQATLVELVRVDNPRPDLSLDTAIDEFLRQLASSGDCVARVFVDTSISADPSNESNPCWVVSTKYPSGLETVYAFAEDLEAEVVADGQEGGGATTGSERVRVRGEYTYAVDPLDPRWPMGSASSVSLTVVDPSLDCQGGYGNWLRNGDFNEWEESSSAAEYTPKYWRVEAGVAGTNLFEDSSGYDDTAALVFYGDGTTNITVTQAFGSTTGTPLNLRPLDQFAVLLRLKATTTGVSGTLRVALVDSSNAVTSDDQGNPNSFTCNLSLLSLSSWSRASGVFRTPSVLPSGLKLQIRLTSPLGSGKTIAVDEVAMARMVPLYTGGPSVSLIAALAPAIRGDRWVIRVTSTANEKSWHRAFDRLFDGRARGKQLPECSSPSILSSLITYPPGSSGAGQPGESSAGGPADLTSEHEASGLEPEKSHPFDP